MIGITAIAGKARQSACICTLGISTDTFCKRRQPWSDHTTQTTLISGNASNSVLVYAIPMLIDNWVQMPMVQCQTLGNSLLISMEFSQQMPQDLTGLLALGWPSFDGSLPCKAHAADN